MITKTELSWVVHGSDNSGSTQEAIVIICCEERDNDLSLENFVVMVTNIDRPKSEEERLSLKMMAENNSMMP
jgi:hypothetical protein